MLLIKNYTMKLFCSFIEQTVHFICRPRRKWMNTKILLQICYLHVASCRESKSLINIWWLSVSWQHDISLLPQSLHEHHFISVPDPVAEDTRKKVKLCWWLKVKKNVFFYSLTLSVSSFQRRAFHPETLNYKFSKCISWKEKTNMFYYKLLCDISECVCVCVRACVHQLMSFTPPSRCCFSSMNLRMAFFRSRIVAFCTTTMA